VLGGTPNTLSLRTTSVATDRIDNLTRQKLERLFDMSGGYVLDFSNASFSSFVESCLGFDPYSRYNGSKAVILRHIWLQEPIDDVAKLNRELLEPKSVGATAPAVKCMVRTK
jgi:hypothetical protein